MAEHRLDQSRVDVAIKPRTRLREREADDRSAPAPAARLLDENRSTLRQSIAGSEVLAAAQTRPRGRNPGARPRALLTVSKARQRERYKSLARALTSLIANTAAIAA